MNFTDYFDEQEREAAAERAEIRQARRDRFREMPVDENEETKEDEQVSE